ncbi:MAG: hypothetical protein M0Q38_10270 [Bacteroidales bacterium]|jgi:hypothetical protein|nr:hypothetical protein [Bacteroidales bacterium]
MINFLSRNGSNWGEDKIYFIFGSGPLILSTVGLLLLFVLNKIREVDWKAKLICAWMAFLMVNALPCSIIAGVFLFDGFGIAFHWLFNNYIIRGCIGIAVFLILIILNRFWQRQFLKAAYTSAFLNNGNNQKIFLKNAFFKPWFFGLIILLLFTLRINNWFWLAFLSSLGYLAFVLFNQPVMHHRIHIMKSNKIIFTNRYQLLYFVIVLVLIWGVGNIKITF